MLPPPQQMRASHDSGLIFQFNGGRALRSTLVKGGGIEEQIMRLVRVGPQRDTLLLGKLP
jgi:hypothetical protein